MTDTAPSKLQQLRDLSVVVADTGDYDAIKRLKPVDCTTNPTLVKKALDLPVYADLIEEQLAWARAQGGGDALVDEVVDRLTIGVGARLAGLIPGETITLALGIYHDIQLGQDADALGLLAISIALAFASLWFSERLVRRSSVR